MTPSMHRGRIRVGLTIVGAFAAVLIALAPASPAYAAGTWTSQSPVPTAVFNYRELHSVAFVNASDGWAVGYDNSYNGVILATTDGGATWTTQYTEAQPLTSVAFVNASDGWAVGAIAYTGQGVILATTDGGVTWTTQYTSSTVFLSSVAFANANDGWAVGENGTILSTSDGGVHWTAQQSHTTNSLQSVAFANANEGWAVGENGTILSTTDGGTTWTGQTSGTPYWLCSVTFVNASDGWAVGGNTGGGGQGTILATNNGGATWTTQYTIPTVFLSSVAFVNASDGWAVGGNGPFGSSLIVSTTNGGATWTSQYTSSAGTLNSVAFSDLLHGCAVGYDYSWNTHQGIVLGYAVPAYTLSYSAGSGGSIVGSSTQVVNSGSSDTTVTAMPTTGYHFVSWSDGYPTAARQDTNVTGPVTASASFAVNPPASIYVAVLGSDTSGNGSLGSPYATVQHAVSVAASGDVVCVGSGTFSGDITMKNGVSLQGAGALLTTLQGIDSWPVVTANGVGASATVSGCTVTGGGYAGLYCANGFSLTITNDTVTGSGTSGLAGICCDSSSLTVTDSTVNGNTESGIYCDHHSSVTIKNDTIRNNGVAGIFCTNGSSAIIASDTVTGSGYSGIYCAGISGTISNCTISGNTSNGGGGGIMCVQCSPTITNDIITGNTASAGGNGTVWGDGGGICCDYSSPTITNDTISGNTANRDGGGIWCANSSSPTITNDTISGNTANGNGGGIDCAYSSASPTITNDTIFGNTASAGGGGICCGDPSCSPAITNCIVWNNGDDLSHCSATYSDVSVAQSGLGNISADPGFVASAIGDFHLRAGSPCIDSATSAGAPATDKDGISRPHGNGYDMGAYEYYVHPVTLTYSANSGGSIVGSSTQVVNSGASGTAVTATPATGYHFVSWSDGYPTAARQDTNVGAPVTVSASFAANPPTTYTLTYTAGFGGTISGTSPQTVNSGGSGTTVTAVANSGYHFTGWSDGVATATRTDSNVIGNLSATANFAADPPVTYTLSYSAGSGGTISGTTNQTVVSGGSGTQVTAVASPGFHFVSWSDGVMTASRTDSNVSGNKSVSATFAINPPTTYMLIYTAGPGGTIAGASPQTVNSGAAGSAVTAVANSGYHFTGWSDGIATATRTDTNVTRNIIVSATFAGDPPTTYTLTYAAGAGGSIVGSSTQAVDSGGSGAAVTAVANSGYHFVNWSDGSTANPRTDTNVTANLSVTANFAANAQQSTSITIKTSATTTAIGKTPVLSGGVTPVACIGQNMVVYVMKPGSSRWTYSSNRTVYALGVGAAWQYKYTFKKGMTKGVYKFKAVMSAWPGYLTSTSPTMVSIRLK